MQLPNTLSALIGAGHDAATAIHAPGGAPLSYTRLRTLVAQTIASLNGLGIGRGDRVAIVLPNGPEMATAFVAIAAGCASCPLNPAYRAEEFEFYLSDLKARALVVERGSTSASVEVARKLGVRIIELVPGSEGSGSFTLQAPDGAARAATAHGGPAQAGDVALILHTSGTTSRPKIVPLTQSNVCASAYNIVATLQLTAADRALNIMPLFHIHGLIAGTLAPLAAGSTIFCSPGFNALKFFQWMAECKPTWYTAVPTMHQTILARAAQNREVIAAHPLRFLRSSSSSIPPQVIAELEAVFNAPLIESYGMTEASHQTPAVRKPGTVGVAAGPEIAIMDDRGALLPRGATGEIVIRGPNVTLGYENNPKANGEAFTSGWFRTGDQGTIDADGYLSITGRLKEIINRGGEKISLEEIPKGATGKLQRIGLAAKLGLG